MSARLTKEIEVAARYLRQDGLVAIPTETVYGLAANAYRAHAVQKIFKAKQRPAYDPLIVHTDRAGRIPEFAQFDNQKAQQLAINFWPGPLTLVLPRHERIPHVVTAGLDTVGIRIPDHPLTLSLLQSLSFPLAAPSANPFGYVSPTSAQHVLDQLGDTIDCVLDGGLCRVGLESTIVGLENGQPVIYRYGGLEVAAIEKVVGPVTIKINAASDPTAPGMIKKHYSPGKKILRGKPEQLAGSRQGNYAILSFQNDYEKLEAQEVFNLSQKGDLYEAASRLFQGLRLLDSLPVDYIVVEEVPNKGIGKAINDRLRRAAAE